MRTLRAWFSRFVGMFRKERRERELAEEIESHLQLHIADNLRRGMTPEEARRQALIKLGGVEQTKERYRERRGLPALESTWQDLRYAARTLHRTPGFTAVAVLTLALGIGANSAIFSAVNGVLLRPLPFPQPEQLVQVQSLIHITQEVGGVSYQDFLDWRRQSDVFQEIAVYSGRNFALVSGGEAVRLRGVLVSSGLFPLLQVKSILGRWFLPEEDKPGALGGTDAVILSHSLWRQRFGGDVAILGKTIELNRMPFTVVGVMPPRFVYPLHETDVELWTTVAVDGRPAPGETSTMLSQRGLHYLEAIARLKPGVTLAQANAQMVSLVSNLNKLYPNEARGMRVISELEALVGDSRTALLVLLGSVGCVLLIACANLASLLLSRTAARRRELAIRTALGAGRARILQQLVVENVMLGVMGGALGLLAATEGVPFLVQLAPENLPRLGEIRIDRAVLAFTAGISLLATMLLSFSQVCHLSHRAIADGMKEGAHGQSSGREQGRLRRLLVVGQVALALILLAGAGLLAQSLQRLLRVNPGFNPENTLTFRVDLPDAYSGEQQVRFYEDLRAKLSSVPGTVAASGVLGLPFAGVNIGTTYQVRGAEVPESQSPRTQFNAVQPGYFGTLAIPFVAGNDFTGREDLNSEPVLIVNEALARKLGGNEAALGKWLKPSVGNGYQEEPWRRIVGIVREVRASSLKDEPKPEVFVPLMQCPGLGTMTMVLRTSREPLSVAGEARAHVTALDKTIPVFRVMTLEKYVANSVAQPRFTTFILATFAALALGVAVIGLYGTLAYSVAQRTREIGIRMALGAARGDVLRAVVSEGMRLAALGVMGGTAGALALTHLLGKLLFGISPHDPTTFGGAIAILLLAGLVACYVPARRAMKVDPMVALRYE